MSKSKQSKTIEIPKSNDDFRSFMKKLEVAEIRQIDKSLLQRLYDKALIAYPDNGKQVSRQERENLYILQERLFGGLDNKLQTSLENIGETLVKAPSKRKKAIDYKLPSAGSVIIKSWKGKTLEIKILSDGFEYDGKTYGSLSSLAKEIAGYAVSGPIFFGLRKAKVKVAA